MAADDLTSELATAWHDLMCRCGTTGPTAHDVFCALAAAYQEPGRFYHDLGHIAEILGTLASLRVPAREPELLDLAGWFHDVVYDSRAKDNEERSAVVATEALHRLGLPPDRIDRVAALIRMTRDHRADPADADAQRLLDADLAILGSPPEKYKEYARAIRREYAWVPEPDYRAGRRAVLRQFLGRPRIFATEELFGRLEDAARRNLAGEIAELS
jgi:predicted metal-dependent HD superfamily phosphohydrolase